MYLALQKFLLPKLSVEQRDFKMLNFVEEVKTALLAECKKSLDCNTGIQLTLETIEKTAAFIAFETELKELIRNAIDAQAKEITVGVDVDLKNSSVNISVNDDGKSIPQKMCGEYDWLSRIQETSEKCDDPTQFGGNHLALAMISYFVKRYGNGSLLLSSAQPKIMLSSSLTPSGESMMIEENVPPLIFEMINYARSQGFIEKNIAEELRIKYQFLISQSTLCAERSLKRTHSPISNDSKEDLQLLQPPVFNGRVTFPWRKAKEQKCPKTKEETSLEEDTLHVNLS